MKVDRFGNPIDPSVGYARGQLISSSTDEVRRLRHAQAIVAELIAANGVDGIGIFTGNPRHFPLQSDDPGTICREWVGPGLFAGELAAIAISHLGGREGDLVAVFNRTSAAILAGVLALHDGRAVVSFVPEGGRSHASVNRACRLAGASLIEECGVQTFDDVLARERPALAIVTTVTSSLARLPDDRARAAIRAARQSGARTILDEAYGARLRPVLHGGERSLKLGADLAVTNADKAGLAGPRAGILVGRPDTVLPVQAKASEFGLEARAPIAASAMRALQGYDPEHLRAAARDGTSVTAGLEKRFGTGIVKHSDLGPSISEEDILALVMERRGVDEAPIVPAEASTALGMHLLRNHGVLTVNTHGAPGGLVSLRLKPTHDSLNSVGGVDVLVDGVDGAINEIAANMHDAAWLSGLIFGRNSP